MNSELVSIIISKDPAQRNRSLDEVCRGRTESELFLEAASLERFRRESESLYERVRALFFLYALHRFYLPPLYPSSSKSRLPFSGYAHLLQRRFEQAIQVFLTAQRGEGPSDELSSALASAYHRLAFQTLANQVRRSVRSVRGNQWMFRMGHPLDHPLRVLPELTRRREDGTYPILRERTPVRMDLSHCGWSDIFFLGMDFPEGARVLNVSIDLGVHGRDQSPKPPVEAYLRVIDEPVLRLSSVDLGAKADLSSLAEVFDFASDYLGLLKAAVIAAGIVPPGIEGSAHSLKELLGRLCGHGKGLELVSRVNDIPKGSRLAVSTNLLAALISVCMRATGQAASLTGSLDESERRLVLARALLGEWLGGSGGGWQDSGGVWPGMKLIEGVLSTEDDLEFGVSRGRLMPNHRILGLDDVPAQTRRKLQESLVLVHGGMAQNVGPILEMVTEKYLLRCETEWRARLEALGILDEILVGLGEGDIRAIGAATMRNFRGPLQDIIPWASNHFTETLIERAKAEFGEDFWGFWMLGGMSGGGMGFIFEPRRRAAAQTWLQRTMTETKRELQHALPFAMEPVVYDFAINEHGTQADLLSGRTALMPPGYYTLFVPELLQHRRSELPRVRRLELDKFGAACRDTPELDHMVQTLFDVMLPKGSDGDDVGATLDACLADLGFDRKLHEQIRRDLRDGRLGLAQNRLPTSATIEDVTEGDIVDTRPWFEENASGDPRVRGLGEKALAEGEVAVLSLAAGAGSRWTQGAGVVKALHPFSRVGGKHRTFVETHLAKSRRVSRRSGCWLPHLFATSYLTQSPMAEFMKRVGNYAYEGPVSLSPGRSVGLRFIPTVRDLRFMWEEMPQQVLDEQQQKVRESLHAALIHWARDAGEASDYTDNLPLQCLHPVGHWFEIANLLRNGVLRALLHDRPQLNYLMLHNIDTLGADVDPMLLGRHIDGQATLSFEVITRRLEDRGGGLARVDGKLRLLEGLAMPREEDEFELSYYNTMTTWISLDGLLGVFGLTRDDLDDESRVLDGVRGIAARMPTYITLKDVKKRWGHGQEDVFPVTQFEKLWGDMTTLPELDCRFLLVPRLRGQQLKDQAQLDGWLRDGSAEYVESLCEWD